MSRTNNKSACEKRNADIRRADRGADQIWREEVMRTIEQVARAQAELTTDDILDANPNLEGAREPRALGPLVLRAAREGWIAPTRSYGPSRRRQSNGRMKRRWVSLIFDDGQPQPARDLEIVKGVLG